MKTIFTSFLAFTGLFGSLMANADEGLPADVIERAKQLALKKDYPAVLQMMSEIDQQFKGVHNAGYFHGLRALVTGMNQAKEQPSEVADFEFVWSIRKIYWQIYLTPPGEPKDAPAIWSMKERMADGGFTCMSYRGYLNTDQFVSLRRDAVALLCTYADSLHTAIIPGYHLKQDRWPTGALGDTPATPTPEEIAEKKKREAEFAANALANATQRQLADCWDQLPHAVEYLAENDFSYPPEDDQMVSALLDQIPPRSVNKETILRHIERDRPRHVGEIERAQQAKSKSTPAPGQPLRQ